MSGTPRLAFDVGGTCARAAVVVNDQIAWRRQCPTPGAHGPAAVVDAMAGLVAGLETLPDQVGFAFAGIVADGRVTAGDDCRFAGFNDVPIGEQLQDRLGRTVTVMNDARAAAWAEHRHGAGQLSQDMLYITLSTGVGAGLVLGGRLHTRAHGLDGELGESPQPDGRNLEAMISGAALGRRGALLGYENSKGVLDAFFAGDRAAVTLVDPGLEAVARHIGLLRVLLGIELVVLGGSIGLRKDVQRAVEARLLWLGAKYYVPVVHAALGEDAGLIGAAALAADRQERAARSVA